MFESMSSKAHQAHIARWADNQHSPAGFKSRLEPNLPSLNPYYNRPSSHRPCVKFYLVGGRDKYPLGSWASWARKRGGSVTSPSSMGSASLPPAWKRRRGIQPTTVMDPTQPTRPITAEVYHSTALLRANFRKSFEITFGRFTTPGRYHEMMMQQPAPTADQVQLNPAAVPMQRSYSMCSIQFTSDFTARTSTNTRNHIDTHPVNQELNKPVYRSHSFCNYRLQHSIHERPHCSD